MGKFATQILVLLPLVLLLRKLLWLQSKRINFLIRRKHIIFYNGLHIYHRLDTFQDTSF